MSAYQKKELILCPHCKTKHKGNHYKKSHGDNCKYKLLNFNRQHITEKINTYNEAHDVFIDTFIKYYNLHLAFLNKSIYTRVKDLGINHKEMLKAVKNLKNINFELRKMIHEDNKKNWKRGKTNGNN